MRLLERITKSYYEGKKYFSIFLFYIMCSVGSRIFRALCAWAVTMINKTTSSHNGIPPHSSDMYNATNIIHYALYRFGTSPHCAQRFISNVFFLWWRQWNIVWTLSPLFLLEKTKSILGLYLIIQSHMHVKHPCIRSRCLCCCACVPSKTIQNLGTDDIVIGKGYDYDDDNKNMRCCVYLYMCK